MRSVSFRTCRRTGAAAATALVLALAGCSNPVTQGISNAGSNLSQRLSVSSGQQNTPIPPADRPDNRPCPKAVVRDGTQTLRVYERAGEGDPDFIRYQGSIQKVARECVYSGDEIVAVRFGVSGRVVTGPRGGPGTYSLPIRAAFVLRGGAPVWGDLFKQDVTINPGESSVDFVMVQQTAAVTIEPGKSASDYTVYVGFDESSRN